MEPLVPAIVDLRDFPYMPLDVVRLRDSRLASHVSGEGFRCAVLLWCAAWHQVPAASLPDDDIQLAQYAGFGRSVREWRKVRDESLHGWVKCSDGRLYHPTVAEKVLEAWDQRLQQRFRTECARIKKAAQRADTAAVYPTFDQWEGHLLATGSEQWRPTVVPVPVPRDSDECPRNVPGDMASKGREGKGREGKVLEETTKAAPAEPAPPDGPVLLTIPLNDGSEFAITEANAAEFGKLYPAIDVPQQLRAMRAWALANPKNRKTRSGAMRFVNSWLSRAQDRAPSAASNGSTEPRAMPRLQA